MDLLNSILNSMDKPPSASEKEKELIKKHKKYNEEILNKQKEELSRFKKYTQDRISRFSKDDRKHIEFQPFDKLHRSIIHQVAENGGFIAMSFGLEDIDRYTVVYKKETAPSEDEITARRNGDTWNAEIAKEYAKRRLEQQKYNDEELERIERNSKAGRKNANKLDELKTPSNYKDKYVHLIGQSAAKEAARKTETNQSYGFVPSKNKKDMRSIEQTLADIQAKKRLRLQQPQPEDEEIEPPASQLLQIQPTNEII